MDTAISKLTVLFEDPFWIALYEREVDGIYEVCKITFGAEPKDSEVSEFFLKNWGKLQFSPSIEATALPHAAGNPKRLQRQIKKQLQNVGLGTKAQQALKLQQEQGKLVHKERSRELLEAEKERRFELHQQKRKEKHKGH